MITEQTSGSNIHQKAFRIAPIERDLTSLILDARDEVVEDNELSHGARLMFVRLLDLSVRQASNVRPGVVTISQMKLAEKLGVSLRTIFNWKRELVTRGSIWMTSQPMPNAWPIDTYHITAVHPRQNTGDKTTVEGLWGNGERQRRPEQNGPGFRSKRLPVENSFQLSEKSSNFPINAAPRRNRLPLSVATSCEPPPKQVASHRRNRLRATAETDCEHKKAQNTGSSVFEGGTPPPAKGDQAFREWEKQVLTGMFPSGLRDLEKKIRARLQVARSESARLGIKRQLKAVQDRLLPPVPDEPEKTPVKVAKVKPAPLPAEAIATGLKNLRKAVRA